MSLLVSTSENPSEGAHSERKPQIEVDEALKPCPVDSVVLWRKYGGGMEEDCCS